MMDVTRKSVTDSKRFAVIRAFEPARIERELLAQVFEVVSRDRSANLNALEDGQRTPVLGSERVAEEGRPDIAQEQAHISERTHTEAAA